MCAGGRVPSQSCRSPSGPEPTSLRAKERTHEQSDRSQIVDVVIGVDTHVATHSAAAVDTATGGVLREITVEATPEGYDELVEFADEHAGPAGLGDRGNRRPRRRSDPPPGGGDEIVDRAGPARSGPRAATARSPTRSMRSAPRVKRWLAHQAGHSPERRRTPSTLSAVGCPPLRSQRLRPRPSSRSSAWSSPPPNRLAVEAPGPEACRDAQHRRAAARAGRRGTSRPPPPSSCCATLARRALEICSRGDRREKEILAIVRSWRPDLLEESGRRTDRRRHGAVRLVASRDGSTPRRRSRCSAASHRSRPTAARSPPTTGSTATATASSTAPCTPWCCPGSAGTSNHPRLRQPTHSRGQDPARDQALPQPLRRPRPLPPPRARAVRSLTMHRSVRIILVGARHLARTMDRFSMTTRTVRAWYALNMPLIAMLWLASAGRG